MKVTLEDFEIANGYDRTLQVLGEESLSMKQQTQTAPPMRASWSVAYPSRANRSIDLSYTVTFPPCDSLEAALMESRMIPASSPNGGTLVEYHSGVRITYEKAWIVDVQVQRLGVTNRFTFSLSAINPTAESLLADEAGEVLEDDDGAEMDA